jgi:hypothetical protein
VAILKPTNISPNNIAQDANNNIVISWTNNGDRQYYYQIKIYQNLDNILVYDTSKIYSLNTFHSISQNTLNNGNEYKYQITVWNQNDESVSSDWIIFKCSSTPIATFTNISDGSEILNSFYLFQGSYSQSEGISIKSWNMLLYDESDYIIGNTGVQYSDVIEYKFEGLNNDSNYKIELQVRSQDDLIATTGKVPFHVRYEVPSSTITLQAENVPEKAGVRLSWKVVQIIGNVIDGSISYIGNDKIDLTNGIISFSDGMPNFKNFNLKLWLDWIDLKNEIIEHEVSTSIGVFTHNVRDGKTEILRLKTPLGDIWLEWIYDNDTSGKFHLYKNFYNTLYHIQSDSINPINGDIVYIGVNYNSDLADIYTQII